MNTRRLVQATGVGLIALLCGCNTPQPKPQRWVFFPRSPNEPRIQHLASFCSDRDFGRDATFTEYLTGEPPEVVALAKPYGIAIRPGQIRVCDTGLGAIAMFDLTRKRGRYFAPRGNGKLVVPINLTLDVDGTQYIADTGRNQVLIFDNNDEFIEAIGQKDELKPTDVAVSTNRLYVTDLKNSQVRVYDKLERKFLFAIPRGPVNDTNRLYQPTNIALDDRGNVIVSDTGGFRVQVYDTEGNYVRSIGKQGTAPGYFARPKGVAVARDGTSYVVDASTQVVQMFDPEGRLLMFFGQPGESERGELTLPAAVKVDYDNLDHFRQFVSPDHQLRYLIFVTSQFGAAKVNVYGFIEKR